jgi:hypothetical protein
MLLKAKVENQLWVACCGLWVVSCGLWVVSYATLTFTLPTSTPLGAAPLTLKTPCSPRAVVKAAGDN